MSSSATADRLDSNLTEEKLSDRDIQLIQRYLSDPSVFPKEFKRWITEHSSDTVDIAKTQVHGLVNNSGQVVIGSASMGILGATLVGVIVPYAANVAPESWLLCDGHEELRADYPTLFGLLGTVWGIPSDAQKFKVPDLRGRAPFGVDGNVGFAATDGLPAGGRGAVHRHWFVDTASFDASGGTNGSGNHGHSYLEPGDVIVITSPGTGAYNYQAAKPRNWATTQGAGDHSHGVSVSGSVVVNGWAGGSGGPADQVGWVGLNYIMGSGKLP